MIRGAIEQATRENVSGWLYCQAMPLRGGLVLAFVGEECVGTGRIEFYREDLHKARLGDGYCGFYFPVQLQDNQDPAAIVVRLADSDLSLLQRGSLVVGGG